MLTHPLIAVFVNTVSGAAAHSPQPGQYLLTITSLHQGMACHRTYPFHFEVFVNTVSGAAAHNPQPSHHPPPPPSLNREGRLGTTDDFATSFLHLSLFSTALWDLVNSRPVHSLMLSSHLFLCLPCLLPLFTVPCKMVSARPDEWET